MAPRANERLMSNHRKGKPCLTDGTIYAELQRTRVPELDPARQRAAQLEGFRER